MAQSNGIRDSILQAIGNTPVVRLRKVVTPSIADVLVKLEYYNPTGSYKDRFLPEGSPKVLPFRLSALDSSFASRCGVRMLHGRQVWGKLRAMCGRVECEN